MALLSAQRAKHPTLTGTTVDTVTLGPVADIEVFNRAGSADLWVAVSAGAVPSDPAVNGDDCEFVPAGTVRSINIPGGASGHSIGVKIIGNGNLYSVVAVY